MAKYGLSTFLHAPYSNGTYGTVSKLAGAIGYKETINTNSYKDYEDNALKWSDESFKDGNINLTIGDDDKAVFSGLLGRSTKTLTGGKVVYAGNLNDISVPVGFGLIENIRTEAGLKYGVKFYPNVTFKPYATEGKTKDGSGSYTTPSVDGAIAVDDNGDYIFEQRYDTLSEAITVLYACFGKSVPSGSENADMAALTIGDLALSPTFNAGVTSYVASTTDANNIITAAPSDSSATIVIKNGTTTVVNEAAATWTTGANTVTVTVTKGTTVKVYTVTVTKTA
jgi:hypothetical protein